MASRYVVPGDTFVPQRIAELIVDYVYKNLAIFNTQATRKIGSVNWGIGGNTVTFPVFGGLTGSTNMDVLGTADTLGTGAPETRTVTMSTETKDVISRIIAVGMKGITIEDAYKSGDFDLVNQIFEEVALRAAKEIDLSLITEAQTSSLTFDATALATKTCTRSNIIKAKAKWGDMLGMNATLVLHSKCFADLVDEVKDYNIYGQANTTGTGTLPSILGMPIVVSDNVPLDTGVYKNKIIANGGLGFAFHRDLTYNAIRQPGDQVVHEWSLRWITKLFRTNGRNLSVEFLTN